MRRLDIVLLSIAAAAFTCCACNGNQPAEPAGPDMAQYKGLVLNEIGAHDQTTDADSWVEILNSSDKEISLDGVGLYLHDEWFTGKEIWKGDANAKLAPGERIVLHTVDETLRTGFASNADFKLALMISGETIDSFSRDEDVYPVKANTARGSYQRIPDGTGEWKNLTYASEGAENTVFDYKKTLPNAIWVWSSHRSEWMADDCKVMKELYAKGYRHILLNHAAFADANKRGTLEFIEAAEATGFTVHAWVQCFYNGSWINPIDDENKVYKEEVFEKILSTSRTYIEEFGVRGLHLDYIRFGGTASKHNPSMEVNSIGAVNRVCREIRELADSYDEGIVTSAALMPEPNTTEYYAQNPTSMGKYLHILMPMTYRYSYGMSDSRVRTVTDWFVSNAGDAEVWSGMQTYNGNDDHLTQLTAEEIRTDAELYASTTCTGIVLFRYGLGEFPDINDLWDGKE